MSALVNRAIDAAGLRPVLTARRAGGLGDAHDRQLRAADLLALGALADRVRADEVGDEVRIFTNERARVAAGDGPLVTAVGDGSRPFTELPPEGRDLTGLELLREVAVVRVLGPASANVRVNFSVCGLELAQVALGFGANELVGHIANKRGLPLAEGAVLGVGKKSRHVAAHLVKQAELASFVERAGRTPRFV